MPDCGKHGKREPVCNGKDFNTIGNDGIKDATIPVSKDVTSPCKLSAKDVSELHAAYADNEETACDDNPVVSHVIVPKKKEFTEDGIQLGMWVCICTAGIFICIYSQLLHVYRRRVCHKAQQVCFEYYMGDIIWVDFLSAHCH